MQRTKERDCQPSTDFLLSRAVMLAGQVEELVYRLYQRMDEEEAHQ